MATAVVIVDSNGHSHDHRNENNKNTVVIKMSVTMVLVLAIVIVLVITVRMVVIIKTAASLTKRRMNKSSYLNRSKLPILRTAIVAVVLIVVVVVLPRLPSFHHPRACRWSLRGRGGSCALISSRMLGQSEFGAVET